MISKGVKLNNRYLVEEVIGEGGGGIVYRAFDVNLQSYVVVKQMKEDVKSFLECRTEADILKGLTHENLPKVLDFFEDGEKVYTVIDYIEGISLSEAIKQRGHFGQKEVLQWARQLAHALAYLHSQKPPIIHSDIKPANIMWNEQTGRICLIDFNISLAFNRGQKQATWISSGYSPPEQYQTLDKYKTYLEQTLRNTGQPAGSHHESESGNINSRPTKVFDRKQLASLEHMINKKIDERSDVYSFGATIYHLLTGVKAGVDFLSIPALSRYDIPLGEGFCHIIEKCMQPDPAKRYASGIALSKAFDEIYELDSEYRAFRKKRFRNKLLITGLYLGGFALIGGSFAVHHQEQVRQYKQYIYDAETAIKDLDYAEALANIERARGIDRRNVAADALELLAIYKSGTYEECQSRGEEMLSQAEYRLGGQQDKETLGNIYYLIGSSYLEQRLDKRAIAYYEKALEYNQNNPLFYRDYGIALARYGKIKDATAVLDELDDEGMDQLMIDYLNAEISFAKQDYAAAEKMLKDILDQTTDVQLRERSLLCLNDVIIQSSPDTIGRAITLLMAEKERMKPTVNTHLIEALAGDYYLKYQLESQQQDGIMALNEYISLYNTGYQTLGVTEKVGILYRELGYPAEADKIANQLLERYPASYKGHKLLAFLELDKQSAYSNENRNYQNFQISYHNAKTLYQKQEEQNDAEMEFLKQMEADLKQGGWY